MLPRIGASKLVSTSIWIVLVASIVSLLDGGWLADLLALQPERVFHGHVWRVVTWPIIAGGPMGIVATCLSIYKFGGELAPRWGERRLRRFMLHLVLAAGVLTTLGALLSDHAWNMSRTGGWAISDALVIAWARQYPTATLRLYGLIELHGKQLIWFTAGVTGLIAIATSPFMMMPEIVACLLAAYYPRSWLAR